MSPRIALAAVLIKAWLWLAYRIECRAAWSGQRAWEWAFRAVDAGATHDSVVPKVMR